MSTAALSVSPWTVMAFTFGNGGPFVEAVQNDKNLTLDRSNASFVYLTLNVSFNSS